MEHTARFLTNRIEPQAKPAHGSFPFLSAIIVLEFH
jgi:hypothetical protein